MYAEVTPDISGRSLERTFTYRIPEELRDAARVGARCRIPFGNGGRMADGFITALSERSAIDEERIKSIESIATNAGSPQERMVALAARMAEYYSCSFIKALRVVLPVKKKIKARTAQEPFPEEETEKEPVSLSPEQKGALDEIRGHFAEGHCPVLLQGGTGSGKTLIYMELIGEVLRSGKQAILLIPEISLTYQTVRRFASRFGDQVAFLHSRLSDGERYELQKRASAGEIGVMIGPRSALFAPFPDLGIIVIDEEHESSYQSESMPRYDARTVAEWRAEAEGADLLLGSATPSLLTRYKAEKGIYARTVLPARKEMAGSTVRIVDLREETRLGNRLISRCLAENLETVLQEGHQAMLFLNRRGYAGFFNCKSCGFVVKCPHCDVALTLHKDGRLHCHYCGFTKDAVKTCPSCGSPALGAAKAGTQQVVRELNARFPDARILRMDADTTGGKEGHAKILAQFARQEAQILVGTQMIVKGHDYPNVALIGVLLADQSLFEADYASAERTFALLTQAVGRAGRGSVAGTAVIQTYQPEHYAIRAAASQDTESFRTEEMRYRKLMGYPPYGEMLTILGSGKDPEKLHKGMEHIAGLVRRMDKEDTLRTLGPAPLPVYKIRDRYREGVYLRCETHEVLRVVAERLREYMGLNRGFDELVIQFDYNG